MGSTIVALFGAPGLEGVKFFLSSHINQDPLESFFGCQRQRGRGSDNPTVKVFCKNTQVIGTFCRDTVKGNCRGTVKKGKRPL